MGKNDGPSSRGRTVNVAAAQITCKRCGRPMSSVAEIAPFGGDPGLVALTCTDCGTMDSVLVHQPHKSQQASRSRVLERAAAMST